MMQKRQVEEHIRFNQIKLKKEDAIDRVKWLDGLQTFKQHEGFQLPLLTEIYLIFKSGPLSLSLNIEIILELVLISNILIV